MTWRRRAARRRISGSRSRVAVGLITVAAVVSTDFGMAQTPDTLDYLYSGAEFNQKGTHFRVGYVTGAFDAYLMAAHLHRSGVSPHDFARCKDEWTPHQLMALVDLHLARNRDHRSNSAALASHEALAAACPSAPQDQEN